jgi:KaiC/GvpD/RAD55 family RecA-like ATPase
MMIKSDTVSFSKFGTRFQENLTKLIMVDRVFADQVGEVLDTNFFEVNYLKVFTDLLYDYKTKYTTHPTLQTMASVVMSEMDQYDEVTQKQVKDFLVRIHGNREVDGIDFIKDTSLDFCRKQKLKEAIIKSAELLQDSSFDEIAMLINDALKLGESTEFGYEYLKDFEERFLIKARNPVATGWSHIDDITEGGLGTGELGVAIAATGAGKSHIMVHLGAQAVKAGLSVVHYTLELSDTIIARRYDSCITGIGLSDLNDHKDEILETIRDVEGSLIVKEYPTKSATTQTIQSHLEKLKNRDVNIDLIILDYADLLRAKRVAKEKRHDLETIYEELRGIAKVAGCPIWTCSQTNRTGYNAELVTADSISEAFSKCFVADFVFTLSRTAEDKETNAGRFFVAKNRFGPDGLIYPVDMDTSNVYIQTQQKTSMASLKSRNEPVKDQRELLREKYDKLMGSNNGTSK